MVHFKAETKVKRNGLYVGAFKDVGAFTGRFHTPFVKAAAEFTHALVGLTRSQNYNEAGKNRRRVVFQRKAQACYRLLTNLVRRVKQI